MQRSTKSRQLTLLLILGVGVGALLLANRHDETELVPESRSKPSVNQGRAVGQIAGNESVVSPAIHARSNDSRRSGDSGRVAGRGSLRDLVEAYSSATLAAIFGDSSSLQRNDEDTGTDQAAEATTPLQRYIRWRQSIAAAEMKREILEVLESVVATNAISDLPEIVCAHVHSGTDPALCVYLSQPLRNSPYAEPLLDSIVESILKGNSAEEQILPESQLDTRARLELRAIDYEACFAIGSALGLRSRVANRLYVTAQVTQNYLGMVVEVSRETDARNAKPLRDVYAYVVSEGYFFDRAFDRQLSRALGHYFARFDIQQPAIELLSAIIDGSDDTPPQAWPAVLWRFGAETPMLDESLLLLSRLARNVPLQGTIVPWEQWGFDSARGYASRLPRDNQLRHDLIVEELERLIELYRAVHDPVEKKMIIGSILAMANILMSENQELADMLVEIYWEEQPGPLLSPADIKGRHIPADVEERVQYFYRVHWTNAFAGAISALSLQASKNLLVRAMEELDFDHVPLAETQFKMMCSYFSAYLSCIRTRVPTVDQTVRELVIEGLQNGHLFRSEERLTLILNLALERHSRELLSHLREWYAENSERLPDAIRSKVHTVIERLRSIYWPG